MTNFTGQSEHKLDAKGRLFVPRRILDGVEDSSERSPLLVTIGVDPCLYLFTRREFGLHLEQIKLAVRGKSEYSSVMRGLAGLTSEQVVDGQSRILLPDNLRQHAGLKKEVVVIGVFDHVEIWDVERWRERESEAEQAYLDQAAVFFRGGHSGEGGAP